MKTAGLHDRFYIKIADKNSQQLYLRKLIVLNL